MIFICTGLLNYNKETKLLILSTQITYLIAFDPLSAVTLSRSFIPKKHVIAVNSPQCEGC